MYVDIVISNVFNLNKKNLFFSFLFLCHQVNTIAILLTCFACLILT